MIFVVTCQMQPVNSNNIVKSIPTQDNSINNENNNQNEDNDQFETWISAEIKECMSKVRLKEPIEIMKPINPVYLRADFDGNNEVGYAILIQGQTTKKRRVLICKDSKDCFVFGEIAEQNTPVSSFDNDNLITTEWAILTRTDTQMIVDTPGGKKRARDAKGESVGFLFEGGGSVFIFWDGKTFRVVEGA